MKRTKSDAIVWAAGLAMSRGKSDAEVVAILKRRWGWLTDEAIDIAVSQARTGRQQAEKLSGIINAQLDVVWPSEGKQ